MSKLKITYTTSENKISVKNISVREPLVEDMIEAQKYGDNTKMSAALISQICTFDAKQLTMEEVARLPLDVFFGIVNSARIERAVGLERIVIYLIREGRFSYESVIKMRLSELYTWGNHLGAYITELNEKQRHK